MKKLITLEYLRGFTSLYVLIGHLFTTHNLLPKPLIAPFYFGQEAVIIFFMLSGFVIFYTTTKYHNERLRDYFIKRARRIYFPLICAFLISLLTVSNKFSIIEFVGNILMLQDFKTGKPGSIVSPFMGNTPLWSLSYEWIFYMAFPFIHPAINDKAHRNHVVGLIAIVSLVIYLLFPNHIFLVFGYLIIWWSGLHLAEIFMGSAKRSDAKSIICYLLACICILTIACISEYNRGLHLKPGLYPILLLRHFAFALICFCLALYRTTLVNKILLLLKPFGFLAPISYSLYIFHYPLLIQSSFGFNSVINLIIGFLLLFTLAYIVEVLIQPRINKLIYFKRQDNVK